MALSPNDLRNFEFGTSMRGYNKEEVQDFLEQAAKAFEEAKQENLKLSMELDSVKTQLSGLRQFEDTIKNAAIDARRNADMTVENAKKEADLILEKAKSEAERLVGDKAAQLQDIESRINKADLLKRAYLGKLQTLIEGHLEMVKDLFATLPETEEENGDEIEVTDSQEVDADERPPIGSEPQDTGPIKTEEANAAEEIVVVEPEKAETESEEPQEEPVEEEVKAEETPEEPQEDKPIDPELAAALEQYTGGKENATGAIPIPTPEPEKAEEPTPEPSLEPSPVTGIVETDARAEDVPPEFIVAADDGSDPDATDRVNTDEGDHKPITSKITDADKVTEPKEPVDPDKLAAELDRVAAKFEEEMDKAAQN